MTWYNYKAPTLNTALSGSAIVKSETLENFINDYQANQSLYHCYYDLEKRPSFTDYAGLMRPVFDTIHFDFDSDDGGSTAWEDTKRFCKKLHETGIVFHLYFSGNKGFHVAIHKSVLGIDQGPKDELESKVKTLCTNLKLEYPSLDSRIWNANRKFRAYRTRHEESGLYKIRLTGVGLPKKISDYTIDEIRNLALMQPVHKYAHPSSRPEPTKWLVDLMNQSTPHQSQRSRKSKVKELNQGETLQDDSLRFKNFADKRCIKQMMEGTVLPQFNRHDIELALIVEMRQQGRTLDEAIKLMDAWGAKVYALEPDRLKDIDRQVRDIYKKDLEADKLYQYGCYGDVKSAYCSAKCKIYNNLDKKRRPEPLDCNKAQKTENEVRRNPALEKSEGELADEIISQMPELCKSNKQYFQWINTHWKRIDGDMFEDSLLKVAMALYGNQAPIKKVKALVEHVVAKIPIAPETNHFFAASPNKFNFTDCTAKVVKDAKGNLELISYPHDKKDYLSACAPFPLFGKHDLVKGTEFSKYLATRLQDVGEDGVRIIKQMLGAALIPYAPRIFFIEGITNAGKSTLALLIKRLLGADNVAEVQPVIHGNGSDRFNWEPSIGKLANIVLELDDRKPLDTTVLKMIRDKTLISVDRKNKGHVRATLPFFHVYCCNSMPPSLEGNSGALNNRVTMLYFKPGYLNGSSGVSEYADFIWDLDAGGVLEAAREGLQDLMKSGFKYFENDASKDATKNWQKRNDSIALFIEDLDGKEWNIAALEGKEWEKGLAIYASFVEWCKSSGKKPMGKHVFYEQLRTKFGWECQQRGEGGVKFKVSGSWKRECEPNASQKNLINSDTLAF